MASTVATTLMTMPTTTGFHPKMPCSPAPMMTVSTTLNATKVIREPIRGTSTPL